MSFSRLLSERKKNVIDIKKRYDNGLDKIKKTIDRIQDYYKVTDSVIPELIEK